MKFCHTSESSLDEIQKILKQSRERIVAEKRVYFWEMEDRKRGSPHYCIEECACVTDEYIKDLKKESLRPPFTLSLFGIHTVRLSGGNGILPVELFDREQKNIRSYQYHVALLLEHQHEECFVFVDPIMTGDNQWISPNQWADRVKSIEENTIFVSGSR